MNEIKLPIELSKDIETYLEARKGEGMTKVDNPSDAEFIISEFMEHCGVMDVDAEPNLTHIHNIESDILEFNDNEPIAVSDLVTITAAYMVKNDIKHL